MDGDGNMLSLRGRTAIVTGVSAGVGRSLAGTLCSYGATVVGVARRQGEGTELSTELQNAAGTFEFVQGDISAVADCERVAKHCTRRHGRVDILINNAGIVGGPDFGPVDDISDQTWDAVHSVNLRGAFLMSRAVLPAMRAQKDGVIIMVASQCAVWGMEGLGAYNASKAGMVSLGNTIAVEGWRDGIRCNSIILGSTQTSAAETATAAVAQQGSLATAAIKPVRMASDAVARSIAALCLPEAAMITGAAIPIDQAFVAGRAMSRLRRLQNGVELDDPS